VRGARQAMVVTAVAGAVAGKTNGDEAAANEVKPGALVNRL
jgi:hypothetical protein